MPSESSVATWFVRRPFLRFAIVSGIGWTCDSAVFLVLSKVFAVGPGPSNFASSYVGLTFVYWISLRIVFRKVEDRRKRFLFVYWAFQLLSVSLYSFLIGHIAHSLEMFAQTDSISQLAGVFAKIVVTPANLFTNFSFMRLLSRFMRSVNESSTANIITQVNCTSIVT